MEVVCRRWLSLESNSIPTNAIVWRILSPNYGGKSATNHAQPWLHNRESKYKPFFSSFFFITPFPHPSTHPSSTPPHSSCPPFMCHPSSHLQVYGMPMSSTVRTTGPCIPNPTTPCPPSINKTFLLFLFSFSFRKCLSTIGSPNSDRAHGNAQTAT